MLHQVSIFTKYTLIARDPDILAIVANCPVRTAPGT
jgi:hypothetical protein